MTRGSKWIYWLEELTKDQSDLVGKKCANLGEMTRAGFRVPAGFALSLDAYERFMNETGTLTAIQDHLAHFHADPHDPAQLGRWGEEADGLRGIVEAMDMPPDMAETIAAHYEELCRRTGTADCPVATRSAGPASHPGQYETFLHVRGISNVLHHIIKVWASTRRNGSRGVCQGRRRQPSPPCRGHGSTPLLPPGGS